MKVTYSRQTIRYTSPTCILTSNPTIKYNMSKLVSKYGITETVAILKIFVGCRAPSMRWVSKFSDFKCKRFMSNNRMDDPVRVRHLRWYKQIHIMKTNDFRKNLPYIRCSVWRGTLNDTICYNTGCCVKVVKHKTFTALVIQLHGKCLMLAYFWIGKLEYLDNRHNCYEQFDQDIMVSELWMRKKLQIWFWFSLGPGDSSWKYLTELSFLSFPRKGPSLFIFCADQRSSHFGRHVQVLKISDNGLWWI